MEDRKTVFDYIEQLFTTYGIMVVIFIAFSVLIGNDAGRVSTLFALGSSGLSVSTLAQLLLLALLITILRNLFLSDLVIRDMSLILRNVLFFVSIMVVIAAFAVIFSWFPINEPLAWAGFLISFAVCTVISAIITRAGERAENKKMEEALRVYKK